ncbi:MAG: alpha/beta fold hydrolase [Oscillochloris sp.]|nr:alpha/beta fold hydrolase [Oscillochloris sp.]
MTKPRQSSRPRLSLFRRLRSVLVILFVLVNLLAFVQARAATHFVADGSPIVTTELPQQIFALLTGVQVPRPQNHTTPADHNLAYETRMIALPNSEQLETWYVPQPQPRGIVLMFVGYAGAKEGALTPAAKFYQFGYSSLIVDFRGAGGSSRNDQTLGVREAEDVAATFTYARAQWSDLPVVLYGISMGGAAILRAVALSGVQPDALVLEAVFDNLLTTTKHRFEAVGTPGSPMAELILFWGGMQLGIDPFSHNPISYASSVYVPTLLLYGERDPWVQSSEREAMAAALRGPVELVIFPGQGHTCPYVYGDPDHWDAAVRAFLDRL